MTDAVNSPQKQIVDGYKAILLKIGIVGLVYVLNRYVISPYILLSVIQLSGIVKLLDESGNYLLTWIFNDVSVYLVPAVSMLFLFKNELREKALLHKYDFQWFEPLLIYSASVFIGSAGSYISDFINSLVSEKSLENPFNSVAPTNGYQFLVFFLSSCIVSPIIEELIFRRLLLKPFRKYGDLFAIIVSSLFFAITHGNFYQFAYVLVGGFFYAMLTVRSGSLIPSVIVHIINNSIVMLGSYSADEQVKAVAYSVSYGLMFFGIAAFTLLILMRKFQFSANEYDVSPREKLMAFVRFPAAIVGFAFLLTFFL